MTAEIVNLRRVRKRRARGAADEQAEQNRVTFGLSKAERERAKAQHERDDARLSGHRLSDHDGADTPS